MNPNLVITILCAIIGVLLSVTIILWKRERQSHRAVKKLAPIVREQAETIATLKPVAEKVVAQKQRMQGRTNIYAIPDPMTGHICYVGMTMKSETVRLLEHIDEACKIPQFHMLIRKRISQGYEWKEITLLETCETRTEAYKREQFWIKDGASRGWPLTNREVWKGE